jgi:periplasmic protein TonB
MLMPKHEIVSARPSGMTPRRAMTIGGVGLLHVAAIYALIAGMGTAIVKQVDHIVTVDVIDTDTKTKTTPVPPKPVLAQPTIMTPTITPPDIPIASDTPSTIFVAPTNPTTAAVPDSGPAGIGNTHSTPPYPVDARAAAHQGTVVLQMTVGPQGDVMSATVVTSSGFPELDQTAVSWVVAHWKYKPAIQNSVPVTSRTQAAVKFDLKQASR